MLPVWTGVVHAATSQLELERVGERSARMASGLSTLMLRARRAATVTELKGVVDDAAALMLSETHEWWVLFSFQDVKLHV